MEVKINKEIRNYTESMFFGLSMRQCLFSVLACGVAVGLFFLLRGRFGTETLSWMCKKEMADLHRRKKLQEEQERLMELSRNQDNTRTRLREFRKVLGSGEILESFDRVVFESVVEKIVIGGYNDEGVEEPLKITFEYKTGIHSNFNGKDFKPKRKNAAAVHNDAELCSYTSDEAEKLCLHSSADTCGDGCQVSRQKRYT